MVLTPFSEAETVLLSPRASGVLPRTFPDAAQRERADTTRGREVKRGARTRTMQLRAVRVERMVPAGPPPGALLSTARLAETVGFRFPPWQESVRKYVALMGKRS